MKIIIYLALIIIPTICLSSELKKADSLVRKDYQKSLQNLLENINTGNQLEKIEFSIPTTEAESLIYFSSDYDEKLTSAFQTLQERIVNLSIKGNAKIFVKYLYLSQFVDGYFAEDYFDNVEKIARSSKKMFCSILPTLNQNKTKRLKDIKKKYCE